MAPWPSGLEERSGSQGSRVRIPAVLFSRVLARTNQLVSGLSRPDGTIALRKRARTKGRNAKEHSGQCRTAKNRFAPKRGDRGNGEREHGFRSPGERRPEFRACRVHPIGVRTPGRREKISRQAEQSEYSESAWWLSESSDYGAPHPAKDRTADKRIPAPRRKEDRLAKSRRAHKRSKGRTGEGRKGARTRAVRDAGARPRGTRRPGKPTSVLPTPPACQGAEANAHTGLSDHRRIWSERPEGGPTIQKPCQLSHPPPPCCWHQPALLSGRAP